MKISDILYYTVQGFKLAGKNEISFYRTCFGCFIFILATFWFIDVASIFVMTLFILPYIVNIILDISWYAINDTVDRYTLKPHAVSDKLKKNISRARDIINYVLIVQIFIFFAYVYFIYNT